MSEGDCPFCRPAVDRLFHLGEAILGLWDGYPVSPGHALLVPKRHVAGWFEATEDEQRELVAAIALARAAIEARHRPDGFNVGINLGAAAGQTVPHLHVHVIPRYAGDMADPRGGVRGVIPARQNYLRDAPGGGDLVRDRESAAVGGASGEAGGAAAGRLGGRAVGAAAGAASRAAVGTESESLDELRALVRGGVEDPLLPHLKSHLDGAQFARFAVAFVLPSGIDLLDERLRDLCERGGRLQLLTGDYQDVTDPGALERLLDIQAQYEDRVDLRVFETSGRSFHPKTYIFEGGDEGGVAFVGSSNLSRTALSQGIEWNYRVIPGRDSRGFREIVAGFDALFGSAAVRALDQAWVEEYRARRATLVVGPALGAHAEPVEVDLEPTEAPPEPHAIQKEALAALERTRAEGARAGLVVLATGLGKTWLSAFDSQRPEFRRVLFVAHREEILGQAMKTFRRIRPTARLGLYTGKEKDESADVLFASVQTLSRNDHLRRFDRRSFDYLVVDEFHHAAAQTYRRLIDYFEPGFFLGLTATPERTDGGDLLSLCGENLVYRCDMREAIARGFLSTFRYFGVPDAVDYANIPWRSHRFDEEQLTDAVATRARAQNALEQLQKHGGERVLAFCCSTRHADFMCRFFEQAGIRSAAVHSGPTSDPRAGSLERLEAGELQVVFAVDMFNEGVDIPQIDTVLMLRPTESQLLWTQQFGRGLRKAEGKQDLAVIDYIGNHRSFLLKVQALFELLPGDAHVRELLERLERGAADLPPGCEVTYELETVDILRSLLRENSGSDVLRSYYETYREQHGRRPTASEAFHDGYSPRVVAKGYGSWLRFVEAMGDLGDDGALLDSSTAAGEFLAQLETTPMTRSFKMVLLLAMLEIDRFPGSVAIEELCWAVERVARRSPPLVADFGAALESRDELRAYLERNPIAAWTGGKGTGGRAYFEYEGGELRVAFEAPAGRGEEYRELAREIVELRLAEYLARPGAGAQESTSGGAIGAAEAGVELWHSYARKEIAERFGHEYSRYWEQGVVKKGGGLFLFVTLEKADLPEAHRFKDRFLSRDVFEWQSQNRTTRDSNAGEDMRLHEERGIPIHLFVRKQPKIQGKGAPFFYCGPLQFVDWEGDQPITVRWRLTEPVPDSLWGVFRPPAETVRESVAEIGGAEGEPGDSTR